jgi:mRNA-degrading endonuclease HigB of HigAB toxin-antitoxin module
MKKYIALVLIALLSVSTLAACQNGIASQQSSKETEIGTQTETAENTGSKKTTLEPEEIEIAYSLNNFDIVSKDAYIEIDGDEYYETTGWKYTTLAELKKDVEKIYDKSWAEQKLSLFIERNGKLYRYNGINNPFVKTKYNFSNAEPKLLETLDDEITYVVEASIIGSEKTQKFTISVSKKSGKITDFYFAKDDIEINRYGGD